MVRLVAKACLVVLELFVAAGAFYGGMKFLEDPTGHSMGMPADTYLASSPFSSYVLPGLVLFIVLGVFPLLVVIAAALRRPWVRSGHLLVGVFLACFMLTQIAFIGIQVALQVLFLCLSVAVIALAFVLYLLERPPRGDTTAHA